MEEPNREWLEPILLLMAMKLPPIYKDHSFFFFLFLILSRKRGHLIDYRLANWHHSRLHHRSWLAHHHGGVHNDRLHDDLWHHDNLWLRGHIHRHHGVHGHVCRRLHQHGVIVHLVGHLDVSLVDFLLQFVHLCLLLLNLLQLLDFILLMLLILISHDLLLDIVYFLLMTTVDYCLFFLHFRSYFIIPTFPSG